MMYMIITFGAMLLSRWVGAMLNKRFREYSAIPAGLTGREVAEKMLADNGISDVEVISTAGQLTDHYNPRNKTVNLSEVVYNQANAAAAAVSAHEVGHAIQHANAYGALKMRSALVPVVSVSAKWTQYLMMGGMLLMAVAGQLGFWVLVAGVALFAFSTLFSLITLPVEFDASNRALKWLDGSGIMMGEGQAKAKNALFWAAMTYCVAALASVGQLLYWIMRVMAARR